MKDIKPNQEGLMSLAEKRPDVVEKMGYDPDNFAAGGIAMLEAGGMAMDPDMAMEVFKEKQNIDSFKKGGLSSILDKIKNIDEKDLENLVESLEFSSDILDQGTNQIISGGIGAFQAPKIPPITRMANGGISGLDNELMLVINALPSLSNREKMLQKVILDLSLIHI